MGLYGGPNSQAAEQRLRQRDLTDCNDTTPADLGSGRANKRRLMKLANGRQMATFGCRSFHFVHDLLRFGVSLAVPIERRNLADSSSHPRILRRCGKRVAPSQ
jgi:hypothetical protein